MDQEFELLDPPRDTISRVVFAPFNSDFLLASSWDKAKHPAVVLDCSFAVDDNSVITASLDRHVRLYFASPTLSSEQIINQGRENRYDLNAPQFERVITTHREARGERVGVAISAGWDGIAQVLDVRQRQVLHSLEVSKDKIYAMDSMQHRVVLATKSRRIVVFDLRKLPEAEQERDSSLRYQIRSLKCMPDGQGYVSGSIEGRVAVDYFDQSPKTQANKYAFKCHRVNQDGVDKVYPVSAIAFHPSYHTFASAGADGTISVWDGENRKRIKRFNPYDNGITSVDMSSDGTKMAVAVSYAFEEGEKDHPPDAIYVRMLSDDDVRPKAPVNKVT